MNGITDNSVTINYNIYGRGEVTLLFIHGAYIDQTYWDEQVKHFEKRYKVVTLDLAGHGKSGHEERSHWSVEVMADDVVALVKHLELKNVILIAHSLGGSIALIAATKYPQPFIGFVGVDNFKNAGTPLAPEFQSQVAGILENLRNDFANTNEQYARMALVTKNTPADITDRVVKDYRNAYEPMGNATAPEIFAMDATERDLLPKLKLKLYLINANYYPTNMDGLEKNAINGFKLIEISGTSHYPMIEHSEEFNAKLDEVVEEIAAGIIP